MTIGYWKFNTVNFFNAFYLTHLINYLCLWTFEYAHLMFEIFDTIESPPLLWYIYSAFIYSEVNLIIFY